MSNSIQAPARQRLSGTALKRIACITMFIDHIGASCLEAGILLPAITTGAAGYGGIPVSTLLAVDQLLRYIGRLAFPIFCFLLVEGFLHTHDAKRYVQRLLLFGCISELPFDLAFFRTPFTLQYQNVYWTLALGLLAMAGIRHFETPAGSSTSKGVLCACACALAAQLAHTDYGAIGVMLIAALYITRADRKKQCIVGAAMMLYELTAPLAFVLVWFYSGQRGACGKVQQRVFYWFYPVHIAVLAGITNLML